MDGKPTQTKLVAYGVALVVASIALFLFLLVSFAWIPFAIGLALLVIAVLIVVRQKNYPLAGIFAGIGLILMILNSFPGVINALAFICLIVGLIMILGAYFVLREK